MMENPPHPPLSPVAGERAKVKQRSGKVIPPNFLPIDFANYKDQHADSHCSFFFALVELTLNTDPHGTGT